MRLAAGFSLLFGLGGAVLVAGVDYGLVRFVEAEVREGLTHQMDVMRADADRLGGSGLVHELAANPRNREARRYLLLVVAPNGETFSNGLTPLAINASGFRRNLPTKARPARWPDQTPNMMVLSGVAADGTRLGVGRDTQHLDELRGGVRSFALWSGLALLCLALIGGLALGWLFLRRLDAVNTSVGRIIDGRETERLPAIGFGREFDDLADNLNQMLDQQQRAFSALRTLSEGVAHELRTPLGRLRNRLEELQVQVRDLEPGSTLIAQAVEEMNGISRLFESLLTLTGVETGATTVRRELVDLTVLIEGVADMYGPAVEEEGGVLEVETDGGERLKTVGDSQLLQRALANLVENALLHGGAPARITLAARLDGDRVVIEVRDRGRGVPAAEREKVLQRFYRAQFNHAPGLGLGLAMVAAVVRSHQGEVRLGDNAPGLIVQIRLPKVGA